MLSLIGLRAAMTVAREGILPQVSSWDDYLCRVFLCFFFTVELGIADCDSHVRELFFFKIAIERRCGAIEDP